MDPPRASGTRGDASGDQRASAGPVVAGQNGAPPRLHRRKRRSTQEEVHDRLALFVVRAFFIFVAGSLGAYGTQVLAQVSGRQLDPGLGILAACGTACLVILLEAVFARRPIRTISAVTFGLLVGLVLSLVFRPVVEFIVSAVSPVDSRALLSFLHILTTTLFCYFGVSILLQTRDDFKFIIPYVEFRKDVRGRVPLIVDTSCFIDGRIKALLGTSALDNRLVVPKFVLRELQTLADSAQRSTRERGRRGMDILRDLETEHDIEFMDQALAPGEDVDAALISTAAMRRGKILTTDYNLQKNAVLQGVDVLNINDLATALKPNFVPGETLEVRLLREGDAPRQAVGFLNDGTMVVVEEACERIGQEVTIDVTSSLQTHAGKMVFGKLRAGKRS
jgi:uncharacterized protein YacL